MQFVFHWSQNFVFSVQLNYFCVYEVNYGKYKYNVEFLNDFAALNYIYRPLNRRICHDKAYSVSQSQSRKKKQKQAIIITNCSQHYEKNIQK